MSAIYTPGNGAIPLRPVTADYTVVAEDNVLSVKLSSFSILITLPAANTLPMSSFLQIKDENKLASSYNITIQPTSGMIDGQSSVSITLNGGALTIMHDETNFFTV